MCQSRNRNNPHRNLKICNYTRYFLFRMIKAAGKFPHRGSRLESVPRFSFLLKFLHELPIKRLTNFFNQRPAETEDS